MYERRIPEQLDKNTPSIALRPSYRLENCLYAARFASAYGKYTSLYHNIKRDLFSLDSYNINRACDVVHAAITGLIYGEDAIVSSHSRHKTYINSSLTGNILVISCSELASNVAKYSYFFTISVLGKLIRI